MENILVIDEDNIEKSGITYQKSCINTNTHIKKITLSELNDMFKKDPESIYGYDTSECLTYITDEGNEISLHESLKFINSGERDKLKFIKLSTESTKENNYDIIVSTAPYFGSLEFSRMLCDMPKEIPLKNLFKKKQYIDKSDIIHDESNDSDGYTNSLKLKNLSLPLKKELHALACVYDKIKINGDVYQGYIPAKNQIMTFMSYKPLMNKLINSKYMLPSSGYWWTSSIMTKDPMAVWIIYERTGISPEMTPCTIKDGFFKYLPMYKKL